MNPHKTNVVIVPTISLKEDMKRRAQCHGILCSDIIPSDGHVSLLLLTSEAVTQRAVRDELFRLDSSSLLGCICTDEFHLFSMDRVYRPSFCQLPLLTCIPVPLVLMTATAPLWIVDGVLCNFFFK